MFLWFVFILLLVIIIIIVKIVIMVFFVVNLNFFFVGDSFCDHSPKLFTNFRILYSNSQKRRLFICFCCKFFVEGGLFILISFCFISLF